MKENADLIDQVNWLLERMSRGQILRVFSYTNRVFCTGPKNDANTQISFAGLSRKHDPPNSNSTMA